MEFTYKISKQLCLDASRFHFWRPWRKIAVACLLAYALLQIIIVSQAIRDGYLEGNSIFETLRAEPAFSNLFLLGFLILCCFIIFMSPRWSAARMYRNHPSTDGVVNVSITLEHVDVRLGNGVISCYTWPFYKYWREGKKFVSLRLKTGHFQFLPTTVLTDAQRDELHSILAASLPKK
jgi:hypothetical protein